MKTVILSHRVKDYAKWKPYFDADIDRRTNAGLKEIAVGANSSDKQEVYMVFQAESPDAAMKLLSDPGLKDKMQEAGVISEPKVIELD